MNSTVCNDVPTGDELSLLRESVRDIVGSVCAGWPDEQWPKSWTASWETLAKQGVWSTIEPPDGSLTAAAVVCEELGRALYPGPACEALAATYVMHRLDNSASLQAVADGTPAAVLVTDGDLFVDAEPETLMLITSAAGRLAATPAAELQNDQAPSLDVSRRVARLRLGGQSLTSLPCADPQLARRGRAVKALLYCADTLGCVERVLERTGQYAGERTTFGSPIGKYQAVAHRLVDHAVTALQMRLLLERAVAAFDQRGDDAALAVATTETFFCRRGADIISDCVQLAGAIGFTWEYGHHFFLRRAVQNATLGGGSGRPHQRLAEEAPW